MEHGILCIGSVMVDVVCPVSALPTSGQGVVAQGARMTLGGCAFNTACAVEIIGGTSRLFAPLGVGPLSNFARDELGKRGMSAFEPATDFDCGMALCLVEPDGERTMITVPGVERHFQDEWFDGIDTAGIALVETCGYEICGQGGPAILRFLEAHPQLEFFCAPGPMVAAIDAATMARINALHPVWHLNEMEALAYTGLDNLEQAGWAIARECGNAVVVTQGARGSHAFLPAADGLEPQHLFAPAQPVEVADTIGAGDSHIGALMARLAQGASWLEALTSANAMASAVCQVPGATLDAAKGDLPIVTLLRED